MAFFKRQPSVKNIKSGQNTIHRAAYATLELIKLNNRFINRDNWLSDDDARTKVFEKKFFIAGSSITKRWPYVNSKFMGTSEAFYKHH